MEYLILCGLILGIGVLVIISFFAKVTEKFDDLNEIGILKYLMLRVRITIFLAWVLISPISPLTFLECTIVCAIAMVGSYVVCRTILKLTNQ